MASLRPAVAASVLLLVAGCASAGVSPREASAGSPTAQTSTQPARSTGPAVASASATSAAYNRNKADDEARALLAMAPVPPGAAPLSTAPSPLAEPFMGGPMVDSQVVRTGFWHVPLGFDAAVAWVKAHPPSGLVAGISGGGSGPNGARSAVVGYRAPASPAWADAGLDLTLVPDGPGATYLRADATVDWWDPVPAKDDASGDRVQLDVASGCPKVLGYAAGVRNSGRPMLESRLLPTGTPSGGLLCSYGGFNYKPPTGLADVQPLSAAAAQKVAAVVAAISLKHLDGAVHSCPMDDGTVAVVVLSYPGVGDVDLWYSRRGCSYIANGYITARASGDFSALVDSIAPLPPIDPSPSSG